MISLLGAAAPEFQVIKGRANFEPINLASIRGILLSRCNFRLLKLISFFFER
jgi:hypothetical protein